MSDPTFQRLPEEEPRLPEPPGQMSLLDLPPQDTRPQNHVQNPNAVTPWQAVKVHFTCRQDQQDFSRLIGQPIADGTRAIWHPRWELPGAAPVPDVTDDDDDDGEQIEDDPEQLGLLTVDQDWREHWVGMPEFIMEDLMPWQTIFVCFRSREDRKDFCRLIGQEIPDQTRYTRAVWYPRAEIGRFADKRYITVGTVNPVHPVYVISKGRWESRLTVKALERMGVPHLVAIEPQEFDRYAAVMDTKKLLVTPFSNLGQGSIPVRNFVWEHALKSGAKRHWVIDDNIDGFFRLNRNLKVPATGGSMFRAAEAMTDRYENVALSGFQYFMFAPRKSLILPFTLNTRIYSCILIRNDLPYRWRGRYNEDTDLSLRALKDGWCTILFNAFLALKQTTMTMTGGNTEALYKIKEGGKDGRLLMAESLRDQHPDLVTIVEKWGRWQHQVNYKIFRGNRLKFLPGCGDAGVDENNFGMELEKVSEEEIAGRRQRPDKAPAQKALVEKAFEKKELTDAEIDMILSRQLKEFTK